MPLVLMVVMVSSQFGKKKVPCALKPSGRPLIMRSTAKKWCAFFVIIPVYQLRQALFLPAWLLIILEK